MFNLNQLKKYYTDSPLWIKKLYGAIPFDIRNGSEYRKWKKFLHEDISREEYELIKLKETVSYAYENTLYYKELFDSLNISPHDINERKDLAKLPIMDKDVVRENYDKLIANHFPSGKCFYVTTGGSSGTPMKFLQSKNMWAKEVAFFMNFFLEYGYKPSLLKGSFRGGDFSSLPDDKFWIFNPANNEINFSPTHINKNTIKIYVETLNKMKPLYLHGFPSSILFLIHNMKQMNLQLDYKLKAIFLVSEGFSQNDTELMVDFFQCKVASSYGHSERLVFAGSLSSESGISKYHIDQRYGLFELVDSDDKIIELNDTEGEIVGTGFNNYAMPLIRYKTGDFTEYINYDEGEISLVESNRNQEYIDGKDGIEIAFSSFIRVSEMNRLSIFKYQIIQSRPGKCELLIIPDRNFKIDDKFTLMESFKNKVGSTLDYKVSIVNQLRTTKRGKFKLIIKDYK